MDGIPRRHGFCCNACRQSQGHTSNCSGYGTQDSKTASGGSSVQCAQPNFSPTDRVEKGGYRHSQPRADGTSVTQYVDGGSSIQCAQPDFSATDRVEKGGYLHSQPRADGTSVTQYVEELMKQHGLKLREKAKEAWEMFENRLAWFVEPPTAERSLHLVAYAQDRIPPLFLKAYIDVARRGVDGTSNLYRMSSVTGVDTRVQAVVANQEETAACLLVALEHIEAENKREFSFVCHGATHRSVACCFLLAALAYPRARVEMTTSRTRHAAADAGLFWESDEPSASS